MDTPYGEIPDRLARGMRPQEQHEYLQRSYGRRRLLKGAAILGAAAVAGPVLWRQQDAAAAADVLHGPQWIAFGGDPASQMYVSWSDGPGGQFPGPRAPQVRWGTGSSYGSRQDAAASRVPVPAVAGEPAEQTLYSRTLLSGLLPGTTYHYSVSSDGVSWSPDATFTTGHHDGAGFRFTAFGDEATSMVRAYPMAQLVAAQQPAFHLVAGDLAYATRNGIRLPRLGGFVPSRWDDYLQIVGPAAAQSIPWQAAVGAHETEPLGDDGYAGFVTRFPQAYDPRSGSPVVRSFSYGNAGFVQLDGNDVSAQETANAGYTGGLQTKWLAQQLASFRASPDIHFIVVLCNCCCYSSNKTHGSDGGLRDAWAPLFDRYQVDLVISGHVHAYERTNPMRAGQPTRQVASGDTVNPITDGTTYICVGGGGNHLYTTWYGSTDAGDAGSAEQPKVWEWSGGDAAIGGHGRSVHVTDSARGFSAFRRAVYCCLSVNVTAATPTFPASMQIRALMPAQTLAAVTSIASPATMDSVTLIRGPAPASLNRGTSQSPLPWALGGAGAAAVTGGAAAYVIRHRGTAGRGGPDDAGGGQRAAGGPA
jgi:Purple acid Phosphatase, N-terminal domain/Calcineurin-like phosphoesterase